jgi:hypothetical protein
MATETTTQYCNHAKTHYSGYGTHKAVIGAFQGFIIVTIIMTILFRDAWWAQIVIIATFYGFVNAAWNFSAYRRGISYRRMKARESVTGAWLGLIIVSIVMNGLFYMVLWSAIPIVCAFFGAISAMAQYPAKIRAADAADREMQSTIVPLYPESAPKIIQINTSPSVEESKINKKEEPKYCPYCGHPLEVHVEFCGMCGAKI